MKKNLSTNPLGKVENLQPGKLKPAPPGQRTAVHLPTIAAPGSFRSGSKQPVKLPQSQLSPPPVYRPQFQRPTAPPVYRPQSIQAKPVNGPGFIVGSVQPMRSAQKNVNQNKQLKSPIAGLQTRSAQGPIQAAPRPSPTRRSMGAGLFNDTRSAWHSKTIQRSKFWASNSGSDSDSDSDAVAVEAHSDNASESSDSPGPSLRDTLATYTFDDFTTDGFRDNHVAENSLVNRAEVVANRRQKPASTVVLFTQVDKSNLVEEVKRKTFDGTYGRGLKVKNNLFTSNHTFLISEFKPNKKNRMTLTRAGFGKIIYGVQSANTIGGYMYIVTHIDGIVDLQESV